MKKVLFLDDDISICYLMIELFKDDKEVEVTTANNFAEFTAQGSNILNFDVVFLDVNLGSGPSGLDAYEWLKKMNYNKKIIFLSGHALSYPQIKDAIKSPNVYFLEKPATIKQIEEHIST